MVTPKAEYGEIFIVCQYIVILHVQGRIYGEGAGGAHPPWDNLQFSYATGILRKKKNNNYVVYWCCSRARDECTPS